MSEPKRRRKGPIIAWAVVSGVLLGVLLTATIVTGNKEMKSLISTAIGGDRAITEKSKHEDAFVYDFTTKKDALENGDKVTREICDEGMVLLKNENNALPLKNGAKVSVFGKTSVDLVYGGSGSAAPTGSVPKTIFDALDEAKIAYNPTLRSFYEGGSSGAGRPHISGYAEGGVRDLTTGETPISSYPSSVTSTYGQYKDAALVVFSRVAGENWDLPRHQTDDPDHHYLELGKNERDLLKHICDSNQFDHVIVLLNSSNYIDLGFLEFPSDPAYNAKIDGAIVIGSPGGNGIMALGDILTGKVNPSGHVVDTLYTKYEEDPVWQNHGAFLTENADAYTVAGQPQAYYFVDYEEGIYVGYRYYETRGKDDAAWYDSHVVYPFGHGLSYTTFSRELLDKTALENAALDAKTGFSVKVKIKNTGAVAGKDVVQLYASAPYEAGKIEKPYKVLVGFAKTSLLAPGDEETVTIDVDPYDFASFDCDDKNGNLFKGYELDKGDYVFHVGINAHEDFASFTKNLAADARFEKDPVTDKAVNPLFPEADDHLQENLSRSDFAATFPALPGAAEREVTQEFIAAENNREHNNPEDLSAMPKMDQPITVQFDELFGLPYDDAKWGQFLDQLQFQEMVDLFNNATYQTAALERLGVPHTLSADGPTGIVNFAGSPEVYDTCYYCSECLVAQTFNLELAAKQGDAIGSECLLGDQRSGGSNLPYTGWYSPGVNIHRSPFGGRNTEYYSEDPFISGKMAASLIQAAQKKGVYTNIKHYALNDGETHRSANGVNTWCNEQAIREIYLKPFEIAIKEGKSRGLMTSFNRIGQLWTGGDYRLVTAILRNEWGFQGSVICDYHTDAYMDNIQMIYAGGDQNLHALRPWVETRNRRGPDASLASDVNVLRRAAHNALYAVGNSNAMRAKIIGYLPPVWQMALYIADGVVGGLALVWGALVFFFFFRKKNVAE